MTKLATRFAEVPPHPGVFSAEDLDYIGMKNEDSGDFVYTREQLSMAVKNGNIQTVDLVVASSGVAETIARHQSM